MKQKLKNLKNKNGYVEFDNNGMVCYYHLSNLDNPYRMEQLAKELQSFCKVFFDNGEECWQGVMEEQDIKDVFSMWHIIKEDI